MIFTRVSFTPGEKAAIPLPDRTDKPWAWTVVEKCLEDTVWRSFTWTAFLASTDFRLEIQRPSQQLQLVHHILYAPVFLSLLFAVTYLLNTSPELECTSTPWEDCQATAGEQRIFNVWKQFWSEDLGGSWKSSATNAAVFTTIRVLHLVAMTTTTTSTTTTRVLFATSSPNTVHLTGMRRVRR